ncbi:phage virion morphogenesis protein [Palleronia caenipelagi]|uniref:Phage virion morphogenesis protein n=1 Tax=Palleronia caenipelagi TaxID=2489174 RepID=A0A547PW93_9RHOB|nr:phage virion morphogenesis protein [Palleronia caenipelagi]TRD18344.1 phage virion morphogenesis protein [Palleronia caenipelagi]
MDARATFRDADLRRTLAGLLARGQDLTPLMDAIGARLEQSARDRIEDTNQSPDGVPWPKSFRVVVGQGGKTLFETGRLAASITHRATSRETEIGTNLISAGVHQFGATITPKSAGALQFKLADGTVVTAGKVTIPARPYLGISDADEAVIGDLTALFVEGSL